MIDIENDIYSTVAGILRNVFPGIKVDSSFIADPDKSPYVAIVEADNRVNRRMRTVKIENAAEVMYEVNVISNKSSGKKTQVKDIANTIDQAFEDLGFTRTMREQVPNYLDASAYRLVMRYEAIVGPAREDGKFLVYQN